MKADQVLDVIASRRPTGTVVYSLTRMKRRSILREFLDVMVSGGAIDSAVDVMDNVSMRTVLIAGDRQGTILGVRDGRVVDEIPVPDWDPAWKQSFKRATVGGYRYTKTARIDG